MTKSSHRNQPFSPVDSMENRGAFVLLPFLGNSVKEGKKTPNISTLATTVMNLRTTKRHLPSLPPQLK